MKGIFSYNTWAPNMPTMSPKMRQQCRNPAFPQLVPAVNHGIGKDYFMGWESQLLVAGRRGHKHSWISTCDETREGVFLPFWPFMRLRDTFDFIYPNCQPGLTMWLREMLIGYQPIDDPLISFDCGNVSNASVLQLHEWLELIDALVSTMNFLFNSEHVIPL